MQRNYDEKREFIRMKVDTPVTVEVQGDNPTQYHGLCKDLSGSGMLLTLDDPLELGATVTVSITTGRNPYHANGDIARVQQNPDGKYTIGIKIDDITA